MALRLSRSARVITLVLSALQFALPAAASLADGLYATDGRNSVSHVEDASQKSCRPPHTSDCAVCQFLSHTIGQPGAGSAPVFSAPVVVVPATVITSIAATDLHGFNSRAPPTS